MMQNHILIVMQEKKDAVCMENLIKTVFKNYNSTILIADTALDGLIKYNQYAPILVIADADLNTLNGFSLSAIIKGTKQGNDCTVYLIVDNYTANNSKVDYYIRRPFKPELIAMQLQRFFEKRSMETYHSSEIMRAKLKQNELLPEQLSNDSFKVDFIYSPFNELSGDCLDYWYGKDKNGLYGFLFDCTGHDICSFLQVSEIRAILKAGFRFYQQGKFESLSDIMKNTNEENFCLHGDDTVCVAAVVFRVDFKTNILSYCSAGIPSFFVKRKGIEKEEEILMKNYLIGFKPEAEFEEKHLSLADINEVIFSSDGFSELLFKKNIENAKHDDVSAIFIQLKKIIEK
jgi:hypothetical protein